MLLRSYRVAIRRQFFSLLKARSIKFRCRYSSRSYSQGSFRFDLGGMTAAAPLSVINVGIHPLPAMTALSLDTGQQGYGLGPPAVRR